MHKIWLVLHLILNMVDLGKGLKVPSVIFKTVPWEIIFGWRSKLHIVFVHEFIFGKKTRLSRNLRVSESELPF